MLESSGGERQKSGSGHESPAELSVKGPFYAGGLRFSCQRCSACCRFESGYVYLSRQDVSLLRTALDMPYDKFIEKYCRWVPEWNGKSRLSLKEKRNYDCIFWSKEHGEGCRVYKERPLQCRTFPFWPSIMESKDNWEMTAQDCPGTGEGELHSRDSIEKMLAKRRMEPIIFRDI